MLKTASQDEQKHAQKQVFQQTIENHTKHFEDWGGILDVLWFQVGVNSFRSEKTGVQVSAVPKLTVSL